MRPLRLSIEGLRSYAAEQEIAFRDTELMAIVGDTGAGKSSILEAICFALYGSSSWDEKSVKELISHGMDVMKVKLAFLADGHEWEVTRTASRGNYPRPITKLECAALDIKIDSKREVKSQIQKLVGLDYKAFLGAVILPQGRFQQLLQATASTRAGILKGIFRLDVLDAMREWAETWLAARRPQLETLKVRRAKLLDDPAAEAERARERIEALAAEASALSDARQACEQASDQAHGAAERVVALDGAREAVRRASVETIRDELDRLLAAEKAIQADKDELTATVEALERERADLAAASKARDDSGLGLEGLTRATSELERLRERSRDAAEREREREELQRERDALGVQHEECVAARATAEAAHADAERVFEDTRRAHAAAHLAAGLRAGEPCPVCRQDIPNEFEVPDDTESRLARAETALKKAGQARDNAQKAEAKAAKALDSKRGELGRRLRDAERIRDDIASLVEKLPDALRPADTRVASIEQVEAKAVQHKRALEADATRRADLDEELTARRAALSTLDARLTREVELPARDARDHVQRCVRALDELGKFLGDSEPVDVIPEGADLIVMRAHADRLEAAVAAALTRANSLCDSAVAERDAFDEQARIALRDAGCDSMKSLDQRIGGVEAERKREEGALREARAQIELARDLDTRIASAGGLVTAVDELRKLLADGKFVSYAVERKQRAMLAVASRLLGDMTDHRFGFAADFQIVDRRAGEARSPDTLSGGETFLASLALALALVELANRSGGRLDALFLDEGFGALDSDALEQAIQALMSQAERGRLVVVISHLQAVAENIDRVLWVKSTPAGSKAHMLDRRERSHLGSELSGLLA